MHYINILGPIYLFWIIWPMTKKCFPFLLCLWFMHWWKWFCPKLLLWNILLLWCSHATHDVLLLKEIVRITIREERCCFHWPYRHYFEWLVLLNGSGTIFWHYFYNIMYMLLLFFLFVNCTAEERKKNKTIVYTLVIDTTQPCNMLVSLSNKIKR